MSHAKYGLILEANVVIQTLTISVPLVVFKWKHYRVIPHFKDSKP